jgi:cysteine desulfurase
MIYLDHAATTPVRPEVADAMLPYLTERFGNPSSIHAVGRDARAAVDEARDTLAAAIYADYGEITFTSGGTEADNLALIGGTLAAPKERDHLVISAIEHHAVSHAARFLEGQGYRVSVAPVDCDGFVDPEQVAELVSNRTALVSVMHANNEIGSIQDIARMANAAHERGALFHTDAVQSFAHLPIHVRGLDCDMLSVSAHKLYGPKGIGALYVRTGVKVSPILFGGAQERERRPGTENTAAIVGFREAVERAQAERETESARVAALRDGFVSALRGAIPDLRLNGPGESRRLPNNVNVSIPGVEGSALLMNLDRAGICASSGSACSSGSIEPSHVLLALGLSGELADSGIRFSMGRSTTREQLETVVGEMARIVERLRG